MKSRLNIHPSGCPTGDFALAGLPFLHFGGEDAMTTGKVSWAAGRPLLILGGDGVGGGGVKTTVSES